MLKHRFSRFTESGILHFASHSHHLWPDVAYDAHRRAWLDAAELIDDKWDKVFGEVIPRMQGHVARLLGLPDPATVALGPNTHELVTRVASCLEPPIRVLTTDSEFHSFRRQTKRWEEAGLAEVKRVEAEPFHSFPSRFAEAAADGADLVYLSHVFYDSGYVVPDLAAIVAAAPSDALIIIDGYHAVMAFPVDIGMLVDRVFYVGGGYKYAMAGEGACFMHCPPGWGERPVNTGWYAGFAALTTSDQSVGYAPGGGRFWGATFDPSGVYRFNAVQGMLAEEGVAVADIHRHVANLQKRFVDGMGDGTGPLRVDTIIPGWGEGNRSSFLTFRLADAGRIKDELRARNVITDFRADRLRIGFGVYHDDSDVTLLLELLATVS